MARQKIVSEAESIVVAFLKVHPADSFITQNRSNQPFERYFVSFLLRFCVESFFNIPFKPEGFFMGFKKLYKEELRTCKLRYPKSRCSRRLYCSFSRGLYTLDHRPVLIEERNSSNFFLSIPRTLESNFSRLSIFSSSQSLSCSRTKTFGDLKKRWKMKREKERWRSEGHG